MIGRGAASAIAIASGGRGGQGGARADSGLAIDALVNVRAGPGYAVSRGSTGPGTARDALALRIRGLVGHGSAGSDCRCQIAGLARLGTREVAAHALGTEACLTFRSQTAIRACRLETTRGI